MRKLTLKKETVSELSTDELAGVVAGADTTKVVTEYVALVTSYNACYTAKGCG